MIKHARFALPLSLLVIVLIAMPSAAAGSPAPGVVRLPGYVETVLDNGLRVALVERHEVPMVCFTAVVGAGSALETEDFSGASHFLEHLLFNGTSAMTQEQLYDAVDRVGGYNNAHTSDDFTAFTMLVPSAATRAGLEIQAAMLFDSTLPEDKFEKERKIVLEELARDRAQPDDAIDNRLREALSPGTAWGRPVIGTEASLGGITLDRIRTYYKRQYVPNNMVLVVMGDVDSDSMLAMVRTVYGKRPRGTAFAKATNPFVPSSAGKITKIALDNATTKISIAIPAPGPCEAAGNAASTLADVLSSEAGPLRSALTTERVPGLTVSYMPRPLGSSLQIDAELAKPEDADAVVNDLLTALQRIAVAAPDAGGIDPVAVLRAARSSRASELLTTQRIHYFGMMMSDALAACGGELSKLIVRTDTPDARAVAEAAARILRDAGTTATVAVAGRLAESSGPSPIPAIARGETVTSKPATTAADEIDRTLSNGLRVIVRKEPDAQVTGFHVLVRDRAAREPANRAGIADVLHRMLPLGTALSDRAQLGARLERLGADLKTADQDSIPYDDYYTSPTHSFVRLEVPSGNWLPALDLLAEMIRTPRLDPAELSTLLTERIKQANKVAASPSERSTAAYRTAMLGEADPETRPVSGTEASLTGITPEELRAFAKDYLAPAGMIVTAVTPAEPADVFGAIAERFDSGESSKQYWAIPAWPLTKPAEPKRVDLGGKQAQVMMGRIAEVSPADRAGVRLLAAILSDRMDRTIREKQGLAYRLSATTALAADRAWMTLSVGTRPDNVDTVVSALREQMAGLQNQMAGAEEIDRIRAMQRGRALMRQMTAVNRARALGLRAFEGLAPADDPETLDAIDRVDRATLERLAKSWLEPGGFQIVIVR